MWKVVLACVVFFIVLLCLYDPETPPLPWTECHEECSWKRDDSPADTPHPEYTLYCEKINCD
jgi:hypothetical protein